MFGGYLLSIQTKWFIYFARLFTRNSIWINTPITGIIQAATSNYPLTRSKSVGISLTMGESKLTGISVLRLAVKLLAALFIVASPLIQTANAAVMVQSDGVGHHVLVQSNGAHGDDHAGEQSPDMQDQSGVSASVQITADDTSASAECCDLFCTSSGFVTASIDLLTEKPLSVRHVVMNSGIAAGEWVNPHRPPNS
jgi:hypothetical protein